MAYQNARRRLHRLLKEGDIREAKRQNTAGYVQATRHKTVEQRRENKSMANRSMKTPSPPVENIYEPMDSQPMQPTQRRSETKPRPTAWPSTQQIRELNPYKTATHERSPICGKRNHLPWHKEPLDSSESPRLGKNPRYNPNYSQECKRKSPTQTRKIHDHMFEDMDSPSSESFKTNITITSSPKPSRREWKEERHPSPNMITRSDYPEHDRETGRRNTRHRSPSPPHPGDYDSQKEKPQRRKAPNGDNLFHYKLWKQLDISRPPQFTSRQLSAKDVARYITGTVSNEDTSRPGMDTIMADSNETGRRIQIKQTLKTSV